MSIEVKLQLVGGAASGRDRGWGSVSAGLDAPVCSKLRLI